MNRTNILGIVTFIATSAALKLILWLAPSPHSEIISNLLLPLGMLLILIGDLYQQYGKHDKEYFHRICLKLSIFSTSFFSGLIAAQWFFQKSAYPSLFSLQNIGINLDVVALGTFFYYLWEKYNMSHKNQIQEK